MPEDEKPPEAGVAKAPITKVQVKKVLAEDLANMVRKVESGKVLSGQERAFLQGLTSGAKKAGVEVEKDFAKNQSQLAVILDISRKTIQRWAKNENAPPPRPNGSLCVAEWRKFLETNAVLEVEGEDMGAVKVQQILLQNKRLANRIAIEKKEWIPKAIARQVFTQFVTEAKARSFNSIIRFVTLARVATSTTDAADEVRKEMEHVWKSLEDSEWFNKPTQP